MFVLPKLHQLPPGAPPPPLASFDRLHNQLPGALLPYWSVITFSGLPEESEGRAAIKESYLLSLARLVWMRNDSLHAITTKALSALMRDEEIEREFINEDAQDLPYFLYMDFTLGETHSYFSQQETERRGEIASERDAASLHLVAQMEEIHRMHVATQFLDSLLLKVSTYYLYPAPRALLCDENADANVLSSPPPGAAELFAAETADRNAVTAMYFDGVRLAMEVHAAVGKRKMYNEAVCMYAGVTARAVMRRRATVIQSAFRGHCARRAIAAAKLDAHEM